MMAALHGAGVGNVYLMATDRHQAWPRAAYRVQGEGGQADRIMIAVLLCSRYSVDIV